MAKRKTILYVSTFPPRECGIATFTKDLVSAMDKSLLGVSSKILALNVDETSLYNYGKDVIMQLAQDDIAGYLAAAKKINTSDVSLINIQHEFGIFGGRYGDDLLTFLELVRKPVIITFHTVLPNPDERRLKVVNSLLKKAKAAIVMTPSAEAILRKYYRVQSDIHIIPHGIPDVSFEDQTRIKKRAGYPNKLIISSFGMLSPNKGYEHVIDALPSVVKMFPNLLYLIIGKTHPVVARNEGETYRNSLIAKVRQLSLQNHVKFYNRYIGVEEIIKYLKMSDIYISPSLSKDQISSGTLSYALGSGRSVISTPFAYAKDIVTPDKGLLAEFNSPESFSKAIITLLSDERLRREMEQNAFVFTRQMTWRNVAKRYYDVFKYYLDLPSISTMHLERMTDGFGMIQFSNSHIPDIDSGYTLDDNARALIVYTDLYEKYKRDQMLHNIERYLSFIEYVDKGGKLYNYVDKYRRVDYSRWSQDAQGRAIWALGYFLGNRAMPLRLRKRAKKLFREATLLSVGLDYPRSIAFSIIGLYFNKGYEGRTALIHQLAGKLRKMYETNSEGDWKWFEKELTYDNSIMCLAMFYSYQSTRDKSYRNIAIESLRFLMSKTFTNGMFVPIGQNGWCDSTGKRAYYDQQPVEIASMIMAFNAAYRVTRDALFKKKAHDAFTWFSGNNLAKKEIYNSETGGSFDGLREESVNPNQGAESTLSYMLARLAIEGV